ncbi:MAG: type II toxin-antitoxin system PrlF family antitoxin [Firmicutes bacterium]|nr:type II toxin-antitoxin system PrlF family antitoxin [Bacillota bacterium]
MPARAQGVTRLTRKFQTSIPKKICQVKGFEPGDRIAWILNSDGTLTLQKIVDEKALDEYVGIIKTTKTTSDIIEELRGPRHENGR